MEQKLLTTVEAAELLGVTTARVRQLVLEGKIEAKKYGRDVMIPQSQIDKALRRKTKPGPAPETKKSSKKGKGK